MTHAINHAPLIAIVGRPNVGKSSLFNCLIGRPVAIVDPTAGVTRDRLLHPLHRDGIQADLIDTGGIGITDNAKIEEDVYKQVQRAIEHADLIVFVCDGRDGVTPLDREVAQRLRPIQDRVEVIVNKIDHHHMDDDIHEFNGLGLGEPRAFSAAQLRGLEDLLDLLRERFPPVASKHSALPDDGRLKICLAGRRNVGKSSLTNCLAGEERVIVADLPGTTRDAIDIPIDTQVGSFLLIDTAGLRKKRQLTQDLEFYAACRTERAIRRADVIFLVLDASDDLGTVDKKLAHFCEAEGKPTALVVNKWDLAEAGGAKADAYQTWLRDRLPGLRHAPMLITCAKDGRFVEQLLSCATELDRQCRERVSTSELNKLLEAAVSRRRPRRTGQGATKLYYATQVESRPPTIVVFVNRTDWIEPGYNRYLENFFRQHTPFANVPIRIVFKARASQYHEGHDEKERTTALPKAEARPSLIVPKSVRRPKHGGKGHKRR